MKSLFAKIMLAQVVAVILALLVVMAITRITLERGFIHFLERQESAVLNHLAPALAEIYLAQGGWNFLRDDPETWSRILRRSRHLQRTPPKAFPAPPPLHAERLHWLRSFDRMQLRERLFLLDEQRRPLAGALVDNPQELALEPIEAGGSTVGWIGFAPVRRDLPAEANRFLRGQVRAHLVALAIALALIVLLAFILARHLSRPVRQLDDTVRDLTRGQFGKRARVFSRDEIGGLAENVNRLAETLEKNRSARHRWMTDIAHELRTPVAILKGEIEALGDGLRSPDKGTFASLREEIDQLSRLVDDLQALALADAGVLSLYLQAVDVGELLRQAGDAFRGRLGERGIRLETELPEAVTVFADAQRIRQLLNNVLENCARYVQDGGQVRLSLSAGRDGAELAVEDSGPGVGPEALQRLFERFYRGEAGGTRAGGGSGLGLAICKSIAEAHRGQIRAEPSALGGLAIRISLPY